MGDMDDQGFQPKNQTPMSGGISSRQDSPPSPPPVESPRQRYLIAAVLILIAFTLGYWVWRNQISTPHPTLPEGEGVENWQTYRNEEYGFEFKYPADHLAKRENNSRNTIVFTEDHLVFGVFIVDEKSGPGVLGAGLKNGLGINKYNFHLSGNDEEFKQILATFRFLE